MATRGRFDLKGFDEYLEKIAQAGRDIDVSVDKALTVSGKIVLDDMDRMVPRLTGNLAEHLEMTAPKREGNLHYVEVGMRKGADADTARYGNVQEYGSATIKAQPYIRPAFGNNKAKVRKAQRDSLKADGMI